MGYTCIYKGIVFIEGTHPNARPVAQISVDLGFRPGAQLKSLNDVKEKLALQAARNGCNAVLDFTYGQKSKFFAFDDVAFWGKGVCAVLGDEDYRIICSNT